MPLLNYIIWSVDPTIFYLPLSYIGLEDRPVVWYGLLFALGFIISQQVMYYIYRREGKPEKDVDTLTTYLVLAVIIGARLGHCIFYNPVYYFSNPIEILKIWEGGLASHGGAIGMILALWLYSNFEIKVKWLLFIPVKFSAKRMKREGQSFLWVLDRIAIVTVLTGALIRTGNLMNSEMEGLETNSNTGIVYARGTKEALDYSDKIESVTFKKGGEKTSDTPGYVPVTAVMKYKRGSEVDENERRYIEGRLRSSLYNFTEVVEHIDFGSGYEPLQYSVSKSGGFTYVEIYGVGIVRHAAQMYEAAYCIIIMIILFWLWKNKREKLPVGFSFGLFMMLLWSLRFVDEFFKMNQEAFEDNIPLNMGQWLSIPGFLVGLGVLVFIYKKKGVK